MFHLGATDHGHKRAVIPDPDIEQASKRPRLEVEGRSSSSSSSATATATSSDDGVHEEGKVASEDEDSEPSSEEED